MGVTRGTSDDRGESLGRERGDGGGRRGWWAAALAAAALAGCTDLPTDTTPAAGDQVRASQLRQFQGARTFDDDMAETVDRLPGFAGMYLDESGRLVVRLTDPSLLGSASGVIEDLLARVTHPGPELAGERAALVAGMLAGAADHDFAELREWYLGSVVPEVLGMDGVTLGDIDEVRNRIVVGVRDAGMVPTVEAAVARLAVPVGSVVVEVVEGPAVDPEAPSRSLTLQGQVRPVIAGVQVAVPGTCTLGYNLVRILSNGQSDGERYLVTNSHCTTTFGGIAPPSTAYQPSLSDTTLIGNEFADPTPFTSTQDSRCPAGRNCRYSDAALIKYVSPPTWTHAEVAWPNLGTSVPHPFTAVRRVAGSGDPLSGTTVHKVGLATGRTTGSVNATCADVTGASNIFLLCQGRASYARAGGDSGAPVVAEIPGNSAHVLERGIHWGGDASNGYFSLGREFRRELEGLVGGQLHTTFAPVAQIDGPTLVPPGVGCWYNAVVSGGTSPFTYQWSGLGSGSASSKFLVLQISGWLNLSVTDSGFRSDQTSIFITVDSSAPTPPGCNE